MLTDNLGTNLAAKFGNIRAYTVGAGVTIYRGATVVVRLTDGLAYPAVEDTTDTYKQLVVGWAQEVGTAGKTIRVRSDGALARKFPGVTIADIGKLALIKDDETVHTYASNAGKVVCGRITSIHV